MVMAIFNYLKMSYSFHYFKQIVLIINKRNEKKYINADLRKSTWYVFRLQSRGLTGSWPECGYSPEPLQRKLTPGAAQAYCWAWQNIDTSPLMVRTYCERDNAQLLECVQFKWIQMFITWHSHCEIWWKKRWNVQ